MAKCVHSNDNGSAEENDGKMSNHDGREFTSVRNKRSRMNNAHGGKSQYNYGNNNEEWSKRCAMKIDVQKAYDTINWEFPKETSRSFGFHSKMVHR
ncbi:hypothetical protein Tco_0181149, partial [Tanacetum coccineum]